MSNGLELPVVSFEEAQRVISSGQIVNYHLDPFLQPWDGPPSGENRMEVVLLSELGTIRRLDRSNRPSKLLPIRRSEE